MRVVPKYAPDRSKANLGANNSPRANEVALSTTFSPPIRGIVENDDLSNPSPGGAQILDNWICAPDSIKMRGGCTRIVRAGINTPVISMFSYAAPNQDIVFAATDANIYDVTNPVSVNTPDLSYAGISSGYYSTASFQTVGGSFLIIANGQDPIMYYDGISWTLSSITGVLSSKLSAVWSFASRLFFSERNSLFLWYLPVDSIGGTVNSLNLAGIFRLGGSILFGASWSSDSGAGYDDRMVVVSDRGEAAVFEGKDPSSAFDWRVVGVYSIGRPLGKTAFSNIGGELVIATEDGFVPISAAVQKDPSTLTLSALSRRIFRSWKKEAALRNRVPWTVVKWELEGILLVGMPSPDLTTPAYFYVLSLETGAWSRITGWDIRSATIANGKLFFGSSTGIVFQGNVGGNDDNLAYTSSMLLLPDPLGMRGATKTSKQSKVSLKTSTNQIMQFGVLPDFNSVLPTGPTAGLNLPLSTWDTSLWDIDLWDGILSPSIVSEWKAAEQTGTFLSPYLQITSDSIGHPNTDLVSIDFTYHAGAIVT